jgi:uncharacterized delta-60 repeat protein
MVAPGMPVEEEKMSRGCAIVSMLVVFGWGMPTEASAAGITRLPSGEDFYEITRVEIAGGRALIAGTIYGDSPRSAFAVLRVNPDGTLDASFNGGFVKAPIWGYYESADALAVQPDGKIVVGGNAAYPRDPEAVATCYPAFCDVYPAIVRLNADGTPDISFNGYGKIVLAIGDANAGEVGDFGTLTRLEVQPDGRIVAFDQGTATARLNGDGTLDAAFAGTRQVAREFLFAQVQGLWWNAPAESESGWGISLAHQGNTIFATWHTYDANGKNRWLSMTAQRTDWNAYRGTLYETRGPSFTEAPFDASLITMRAVGTGTLTFSDSNAGTFAYSVDGVGGEKAITRQIFGPPVTCTFGVRADLATATNYQDLWWAAPTGAEPGWGISLAHQGDTIFATWFTYGVDGAPLWLSATATRNASSRYEGALYRTSGPPFSATSFRPSEVARAAVGSLSLEFANGNAAQFEFTIDGRTQSKAITRQVFHAPGTVCS